MLNSCCKLHAPFCIWVLCSNLTVTPQVKTVPSPLPELWISSILQLFLPFVLSRGLQILVLLNNISFHVCFWTSWPWNKDTVLLYSIQYSKIHKTQPLVEDAHMWQCMPDMWTNMWLDMQMNVLIFESLRYERSYAWGLLYHFHMRYSQQLLAMYPTQKEQSKGFPLPDSIVFTLQNLAFK